jgi:sulfur relay (sulfurtransferase) DsrC/TusE family protein
LNEWPESFFAAFLREIGGAWSGRRPTIKEKAETIEKGLEKLWPESFRCFMVGFPDNEESAFGMIMFVLPSVDTYTFGAWRHIADAANIQSKFGDLWSEKSIYVFGETGMQLTGEHTEIVTFVQLLVYCFYMVTVTSSLQQLLENISKEVGERMEKGEVMGKYPIFYDKSGVKNWVMRDRIEWVRQQHQDKVFEGGQSRSFMDHPIEELLDKREKSQRSVIDLMNSQSEEVIGNPLIDRIEFVKNSEDPNAFENEFIDYGDSNDFQENEEEEDYQRRRINSSMGSIYSKDTMPELERASARARHGRVGC